MQTRVATVAILAVLSSVALSSCGGGGAPVPPPQPTPAIQTISPNSAALGDAGFTLSVVGSNFTSGSTVSWNGTSLPTTLVSNLLLTAEVPANALSSPGPDMVKVASPAPGGSTSNSATFTVPCVIDPPAPAAA